MNESTDSLGEVILPPVLEFIPQIVVDACERLKLERSLAPTLFERGTAAYWLERIRQEYSVA